MCIKSEKGTILNEAELDNLEQQIPLLASGAAKKAYLDALSSGCSVLEVIDGVIYEVFADGSKKKIKEVASSIKVDTMVKLQLK